MKNLYLSVFIVAGLIGLLAWAGYASLNDGSTGGQSASVYFLDDNKFGQIGVDFETKVTREVPKDIDLKQAVLNEIIKGPSSDEKADGLKTVYNGVTGLDLKFDQKTGTAGVFVEGKCDSQGSVYTIGNLIVKNLSQFPEVKTINIYDNSSQIIDLNNPDPVTLPDCLK